MSKRRAVLLPNSDMEPEVAHLGQSPRMPVLPPISSFLVEKTKPVTKDQTRVLKRAIEELGGPFWDRIMGMHGTKGTLSTIFSGWKAYQLWQLACNMYCEWYDSALDSVTETPKWVQLTSKSMTLNAGGCTIRESEVIQAAFDAYNWTKEEDALLINLLEEVRAPRWNIIHERFIQVQGTRRTLQDLEKRAIILHRYQCYFHPLDPLGGLEYLRTTELNSFGLPWSIDWTEKEDATLLEGISKTKGPYWSRILSLYGPQGALGVQLAAKSEIDLAIRAREWWVAVSSPGRGHLDDAIIATLQYIQPKGFTTSGLPTSRGWSDEQDWILISELRELKTPNYNEILLRHGTNGRISEKLAPKNYAQLRGRAMKLYDFCVREKRDMPDGLQYIKRP